MVTDYSSIAGGCASPRFVETEITGDFGNALLERKGCAQLGSKARPGLRQAG
jgi:hypothetical protein